MSATSCFAMQAEVDIRFADALAESEVADFGVGSTGWGTSWIDVDLDGDLDLMAASGAIPIRDLDDDRELSLLLENVGDGFVDASSTVGLDAVGPRIGRGLAAADFDNDGDMDVALGTIGGELTLLRNSGAGGSWLEVGTAAPSPGMVVTVELDDGAVLRRELLVGSSYLSSEDPRVHFGLGGAERVTRVTVEWPEGGTATYDDVAADQLLMVERGRSMRRRPTRRARRTLVGRRRLWRVRRLVRRTEVPRIGGVR